MKPFRSLRLRITLLCALLLTLCCAALAVTSNLSAIQLADTITAVPLEPAQSVPSTVIDGQPSLIAPAAPAIQQAQRIFHTQSLLATAAILAIGLLLIYLLVGHALAPLKDLNTQIQRRTAKDLNQPLSIPDRGDEVTQLAQSFQELSQRLSRAFVMQRSFSQNAAHEFRTPLAVLKTQIGLFRKKQDFAPQTTGAFLDILEGEVDRLSGMVDSLLKLTNLEQVPRTDQVKLQELLDQVAEDMSPLASIKGSVLLVDSAPGTITGNRELLRRALFNLVENAVKYNKENGWVHVSLDADHKFFYVKVMDSGMGIPEESLDYIFERFYRVDKSHSSEIDGTGLGLAIAKSAVLVHKGAIKVSSQIGEGTTFSVRIPLNYIA